MIEGPTNDDLFAALRPEEVESGCRYILEAKYPGGKNDRASALELVAKIRGKGFRPEYLSRRPIKENLPFIVQATRNTGAKRLRPNVIKAWLIESHRPLLSAFLTVAEIPHDEGFVRGDPSRPDLESLKRGCDHIYEQFDERAVAIYLAYHLINGDSFWSYLSAAVNPSAFAALPEITISEDMLRSHALAIADENETRVNTPGYSQELNSFVDDTEQGLRAETAMQNEENVSPKAPDEGQHIFDPAENHDQRSAIDQLARAITDDASPELLSTKSAGESPSWLTDAQILSAAENIADSLRAGFGEASCTELLSKIQQTLRPIQEDLDASRTLRKQISSNLNQLRGVAWLAEALKGLNSQSTETRSVSLPIHAVNSVLRRECAVWESIVSHRGKIEALRERLGLPSDIEPLESFVSSPEDLNDALSSIIEKWEAASLEIDRGADVYLQMLDIVRTATAHEAADLAEGLSTSDWLKFLKTLLRVGKVPGLADKVELKSPDWRMAGMALRIVCTGDVEEMRDLASLLESAGLDYPSALELCSYLDFEDMKRVAPWSRDLGLAVALAFVSELLGADRSELTSLVGDISTECADNLDPACAAFLREFSTELKTLGLNRVKGALSDLMYAEPQTNEDDKAEDLRSRVASLVRDAPGMQGHYHRLRAAAQVLFLKPLEQQVANGDSVAALASWEANGSVEDMAEAAARATGRAADLEERHLEQTRRYLRAFERSLRAWAVNKTPAPRAQNNRLQQAVAHLEQAASSGNSSANHLLEVLQDPARAWSRLPRYFGERTRGRLIQADASVVTDYVDPLFICTWPRFATSAESSLASAVVDRIRLSIGLQPPDVASAVEVYLADLDYKSALKAVIVSGEHGLRGRVENHFKKRAKELDVANNSLLRDAAALREKTPEISYAFDQIELANKEMALADLQESYRLLAEAVEMASKVDNPERKRLVQFLHEAGIEAPPTLATGDLRDKANAVRVERSAERKHIVALEELVLDEKTGERVAGKFELLAATLDRPLLWLPPEKSARLADCLAPISRWIKGKSRGAALDNPNAVLAKQAVDWLEEQFDPDYGFGPDVDINTILAISTLMEEHAPDGDVLKALQTDGKRPYSRVDQSGQITVPPNYAPPTDQRQPDYLSTKSDPFELKLLSDLLIPHAAGEKWEITKVREVASKGDWSTVLDASASILSQRGYDRDVLEDMEAVASLALFNLLGSGSQQLTGDHLIEMAIAITRSSRISHHAGGQKNVDATMRSLLARGIGAQQSETSPQQLAELLGGYFDEQQADNGSEWLQRLFRRSSEISHLKGGSVLTVLARRIWDQLSSTSDTDRNNARAFLLARLFGGSHYEELSDLADTSPVSDLIKNCLEAYKAAESDPGSRAAALQQTAVFRNEARGKSNVQPWLIFMHTLESAKVEADQDSLHVELLSPFPTQLGDGKWCLEISLRPSLFDPPRKLSVRIAQERELELLAEPIFSPRTIRFEIPEKFVAETTEPQQLPYAFAWETIRREQRDLRGTWEIRPSRPSTLIPDDLISAAWPGASGHPVSIDRGFYGRERQLACLQSFIRAHDRTKSVMVYGERRIGKTSLLKQLCSELPPGHGRPVGVFCDMQGVSFRGNETMNETFFNRIVYDMDCEPNAAIRNCLSESGCTTEIKKLARGIHPNISLLSALESLVQRLSQNSNGKLSRLVLIVDEFDRFIQPHLGDRKKEVDDFMWELRRIIQQSSCIALVLAGSGLQRVFKENYQDALFGSIDDLEIPRFRWDDEKDRVAITSIILPQVVRGDVCDASEVGNIARRAAELCDGHPMFLATLGYAAAKTAGGRLFSPALLTWTVGEITKGSATIPSGQDRTLFYAHQLAALDLLEPRRREFALSLAAHISRLTTLDYPWIKNSRLFEQSGLRLFGKDHDLLTALSDLEKTNVISREKGSGRSSIRVPITAECLREDASEKIEECRSKLADLV
jgi:hypothetical protein